MRDLGIGEVARRSGLAVSALHFYERRGLIASTRSGGNQRRYARDVLRRLAVIRVGQRAGIPLETIHAALDTLPASRTPTKRDWARLSAAWRDVLDARIADLQHLRDQLSDCIGCGCLSLRSCRLRNPDDAMGRDGDGPRRWEADGDAAALTPSRNPAPA